MYTYLGCPRIIQTCSFSRFSPLRWNRWCCGFQNFQNYSSGVKAKRHTLPKSAYYSVQSLDQVSVGESFFPFCSKTKQATRYWQEAQPRLPQQTHWHDICWRAWEQSVESAGCQSHPIFPAFLLLFCLQKSMRSFPANFDKYSQLKANNAYFD